MTANTSRAVTVAGEIGKAVRALNLVRNRIDYPLKRWDRDPVGYAKQRLGVQVLMPHQETILRAVCAGVWGDKPPRIAVRSCQKAGKSLTTILSAMWFYECFPDARVFVTAAIEDQTKAVLWRELAAVLRRAKEFGTDVDGVLAKAPSGGFVSTDGGREIRGITGREIESVAGLSGRMLFIIDEASALPSNKAEVLSGNAMGGGTIVLTGNPTRCSGPFYEAFNRLRDQWQTFHVSALDIIRWQRETGIVVPFTVNAARVEDARQYYGGEDNPFFIVRVLGEFLRNETGRCIPMALIDEAKLRFAPQEAAGRLVIGLDPAGPGDKGDETAWAAVRGNQCIQVFRLRGQSVDAIVQTTTTFIAQHRQSGETPSVHVDAEGLIGSELLGRLRSEAEERRLRDPGNAFEVVQIRSSSKYVRDPSKFERVRDELIWTLGGWMQDGAIPKDDKLEIELYEPTWISMPDGRIRATAKSEIRDRIGRSPDTFDALALAVYEKRGWTADDPHAQRQQPSNDIYENEVGRGRGLDPYASGGGFRR
jgi:hypothetical protein